MEGEEMEYEVIGQDARGRDIIVVEGVRSCNGIAICEDCREPANQEAIRWVACWKDSEESCGWADYEANSKRLGHQVSTWQVCERCANRHGYALDFVKEVI